MDLRGRRPFSGLLKKRDTPSRTNFRRPNKKLVKKTKHLPCKIYEMLKEESEEDTTEVDAKPPPRTHMKPVRSRSAPRPSRRPCLENTGTKLRSPAAPVCKSLGCQTPPAGHLNIEMTPIQERLKSEESILEGSTSSSMDTDTTSSPSDEDETYGSSSVSTTPGSIPSPEIFRSAFSPKREDLLGIHPYVQNSTLLDVSNAKTICMHHSPNLSNIDVSTSIQIKKFETTREPEPQIKTPTGLSESATDKAVEIKSTPQPSHVKHLVKKVCFKSPLVSETIKGENAANARHKTRQLSPPERIEHDAEISSAGENNFKTPPSKVILQRPQENPEKAKVFDFIDDDDRNTCFQKMRERCAKMQNFTFFPLIFAADTSSDIGSEKHTP